MSADLKNIEQGLGWVQAALDCKTWVWDGDQREAAEIELAAAKTSLQFLQGAQPLTRGDLADALGCFWNAAINHAHSRESMVAMDVSSVMAEGISAVAQRLNEPSVGSTAAGVTKAVKWIERRRDDYVREHGSYDGSTGMTEFSEAGDEYLGELEEIIEGLQKLVGA